MDSSSDESFVWTKASTGSDDSDEMHSQSDNEKAQQETKIQIKHEEHVETKTKSKSKKRKHERESNGFEGLDDLKPKKIKTEPESDIDTSHRKRHLETSNDQEDDYLNMMVKQERELQESHNHEKTKKISKKNIILNESQATEVDTTMECEKKHKKKKKHKDNKSEYEETFVNGHEDEIQEDKSEICLKSPKKKKSQYIRLSDQNELNSVDEENLTDPVFKETIQIGITENNNNNNEVSVSTNDAKDKKQKRKESKEKLQSLLESKIENHHHNGNMADSHSDESDKDSRLISQRVPRISDRIKFEDDIISEPQSDSLILTQNNKVVTSNLRRFLRENSKLQEISRNSNGCFGITDDDEIWIIKCPHDVDISKLKHSDINLDCKSKIKINGETYCGSLDDKIKINLMSSEHNGFTIKNMVPNGMINFRKRLPKPHFHEDNFMVNNQTDFIPLPETKCRHPLFGSNYKDALNVPIERVDPFNNEFNSLYNEMPDKKKKKKHKKDVKDREIKIEYDSESLDKNPVKVESDISVKKSKKRKNTYNDEHSAKKKRRKLDPDSADAWESEKAIEENLFNF